MKQLTEAQLRKLIEDSYKEAMDVMQKGFGKELNSDWVNRMASNYADKVLESV